MNFAYVTADRISDSSGGGLVTHHECQAMSSFGDTFVLDRKKLDCIGEEPWKWDIKARELIDGRSFRLAHFYSGTFGNTVGYLKDSGCTVCFTIAAHSREISRHQHEKFGIPFASLYPHLCEESLWQRYISGYALADVIICPSTVAAKTVREYGGVFSDKRIEVIPHGCNLPETVAPLPKTFTCGYLGSYGLDKSVHTLLQAWKKLNYKDAVLVLAGKESTSEGVRNMVNHFGGGNIILKGWVDNVSDFYNSISLYVQPSATEGFGIEVLEAMAHARPVLCSKNAGAQDAVGESWRFPAMNVDALADKIDKLKNGPVPLWGHLTDIGMMQRNVAKDYTWDKIRARYVSLWKELL